MLIIFWQKKDISYSQCFYKLYYKIKNSIKFISIIIFNKVHLEIVDGIGLSCEINDIIFI